MQVWVMACGQTLATTSGNPFRPSHTTKQTSLVPRFWKSVSTLSQYFAPSPPCSPAQSPRISRAPATVTPSAA